MTRSQARQLAFELLYSLEIQKVCEEEQKEQIELFFKEQQIEQEKVQSYILSSIKGIEENKTEILNYISQNLKEKWDISRISKINLALLKLAIYEIIYTKIQSSCKRSCRTC